MHDKMVDGSTFLLKQSKCNNVQNLKIKYMSLTLVFISCLVISSEYR